MDFDPSRVSYAQLLEVFWQSHDPFAVPYSRQYKAAVFYHDEGQKRAALESRDRLPAAASGAVRTEVLPFVGFTRAEDYHQKYYLRQFPELAEELRSRYRDEPGFVDSTAAARLNGYIGRSAGLEQLRTELDSLGLSPRAQKQLSDLVSKPGN